MQESIFVEMMQWSYLFEVSEVVVPTNQWQSLSNIAALIGHLQKTKQTSLLLH